MRLVQQGLSFIYKFITQETVRKLSSKLIFTKGNGPANQTFQHYTKVNIVKNTDLINALKKVEVISICFKHLKVALNVTFC